MILLARIGCWFEQQCRALGMVLAWHDHHPSAPARRRRSCGGSGEPRSRSPAVFCTCPAPAAPGRRRMALWVGMIGQLLLSLPCQAECLRPRADPVTVGLGPCGRCRAAGI
eukprot:757721-Hanusia_phi.AAC.3